MSNTLDLTNRVDTLISDPVELGLTIFKGKRFGSTPRDN